MSKKNRNSKYLEIFLHFELNLLDIFHVISIFFQFLFLFFFPALVASDPAYLCFLEWSTPEWPTDGSSSIDVAEVSSNLFARIFEAAFTNYSILEKSLTCVILVMIHLLSSVTLRIHISFL